MRKLLSRTREGGRRRENGRGQTDSGQTGRISRECGGE